MSHDEAMTSRGRRGVTITARLSLVLLAVVAFAVALTGAIGLYVFDESVRQREAREVDVAKHTFAIGLESAAQRNLALASTIASLEPVRSAMQRRDRLALLEFMRPLYETLHGAHGVDNTHFHTERLITVLRMHKPEQFGDDLSSFRKILVEVNETRTVRSGLEQGANGLPIRGVVPVFAPDGAHVGSVEVGAFLKSPMLRRLAPRGVDYTVVLQNKDGMAVYASSIEQPTRILSDAEIASGAPARRRSIASLSGDSYLVAADPLLDYAGRKIGVVEVIVDVSPIEAPLSSLRRSLVMGLAVALLVGFGAALVVGRRLSSPIRDLSETARARSATPRSHRAPTRAPRRDRRDGARPRRLQADAVALRARSTKFARRATRLQRVLDHAPVAVVLTDGSARVTYWNAEARKVFAIAGPEVLGEPVDGSSVPKSLSGPSAARSPCPSPAWSVAFSSSARPSLVRVMAPFAASSSPWTLRTHAWPRSTSTKRNDSSRSGSSPAASHTTSTICSSWCSGAWSCSRRGSTPTRIRSISSPRRSRLGDAG
ncbi:MAG: cache domain-containing protein [Polyangiaceae bacterium]